MKLLTRVVTVLALAAFAAPALPCSDMKATTAEKKVEAPVVAKRDVPQKAQKAQKQTTVAKANSAKPAPN
jgi:hypothetical protein